MSEPNEMRKYAFDPGSLLEADALQPPALRSRLADAMYLLDTKAVTVTYAGRRICWWDVVNAVNGPPLDTMTCESSCPVRD